MEFIITRNKHHPRRGLGLALALLMATGAVEVQMRMESLEDNLFRVLEVPRDASQGDVKRAFRRLSLEMHPDKQPAGEKDRAERKFQQLQMAHETLSNDVARDVYDRWGVQGLKWLERNESVPLNGLVATMISVVAAFVAAFLASVLYARTNAHIWNFAGLALIVALVFGMRFGDEDFPPKWIPGLQYMTRNEKCSLLWAAFTPFCTAVTAIQRVIGVTSEQIIDAKLSVLVQQSMLLLEEVKKKKGGPSASSTPASNEDIMAMAAAAAQQQQAGGGNAAQQNSSFLSRVPLPVWLFLFSGLMSWLGK